MSDRAAGALARLAEQTGESFPHIEAAREASRALLAARRAAFSRLSDGRDVAVCLFGSIARREFTSGSDEDWLALVPDESAEPSGDFLERVRDTVGGAERKPGAEEIFGTWAAKTRLVEQIGLDRDNNKNLTRRILLALESVAVLNEPLFEQARTAVLDGYFDPPPRDNRPPRFFLNDVVRYWRTICVDFVGKERERHGEGWGLRNAKLRNSRKVLFASGLLPILLCAALTADEMKPFLADQFEAPATDRLADAFVRCGAADAGVRTLRAYDSFLALLDDADARAELKDLRREAAEDSPAFARARQLGETLQDGLVALMFESDELRSVSRAYSVF